MPTTQKVHVDKILTNISVGYKNEAFIADQIFKAVPADKQSDKYPVFGKEAFRLHQDFRAPGTEANEINYTYSDDQYYCSGHALRHPIPDETVANNDGIVDLEAQGTTLLTEGVLLNKEVDAAAKVCTSGNYDSNLVYGSVTKWSDYTNSNPITDVEAAKKQMHSMSGVRPNTLVLSDPVLSTLRFHPKLLAVIQYVQRGIVTLDLLKAVFEVDNILIGSALKSSAQNVAQADVLGYVWGKNAALLYIPPVPGKMTMAFGYSFMWNKDGNGAVQVRKWYNEERRATLIEAERWYDQKVVCNVAGALFPSVIA